MTYIKSLNSGQYFDMEGPQKTAFRSKNFNYPESFWLIFSTEGPQKTALFIRSLSAVNLATEGPNGIILNNNYIQFCFLLISLYLI